MRNLKDVQWQLAEARLKEDAVQARLLRQVTALVKIRKARKRLERELGKLQDALREKRRCRKEALEEARLDFDAIGPLNAPWTPADGDEGENHGA